MPDSTQVIININDSLSQKELLVIKDIILSQKNADNRIMGISEIYWANIIIPVIFPVIAFLLVLWITNLIEKRKSLKDLRRKQEFLFIWVELIKGQILKQSEAFKKYALSLAKLEVDKDGLGKLNLHIEKLQLIDSPTLVSIFVTNKKGSVERKSRLLFDFENHVEYIRRKQDSMEELLESLKQIVAETTEKWNARFEELETIIHYLHERRAASEFEHPLITSILLAYRDYINVGENGMKALIDQFIDVAGPLCSKYLNNSPSDSKIFELIRCMKMLRHIYNSKSSHFETISNIFLHNSEDITQRYELLVANKTELSMLEFKSFFYVK